MKMFWKVRKKEIFLGLGIFILALFLRIYNLNALPVFGDEAIYIRWAQVMRAEPSLRFLPLSDGKQPFFMWVVIPFQKVISDPLIAGRLVSVVAGLGTVVGVFVLTKLLFTSSKVSFIASLTYSISPFSVFFDRMALVDSMLTFFGVWTFIFAVITVKKVRLDSAMLSGFFLGGALLTKSPAVFFSILTPTTLILYDWPKKLKERLGKISIFVFLFSFTYAIGYGLYNILRLGPEFHMISLRNRDYVYPTSHILKSPLDPLIPFLDRTLEYFWSMGPGALIILAILGIYFGLMKKKREALLVLSWAVFPILIVSEFSRTMTARYVYISVPFVFVLSALAFLSRKKRRDKYLKVIFAVFVIHALAIDWHLLTSPRTAKLPRSERSGYLEEWTSGYGIREIESFIRKEYRENPDEKIVIGTEGSFGTLPNALQAYLTDLPEITIIGIGQIRQTIPEQLIESRLSGNKTYFVVNSSRLPDAVDKQGLRLLEKYKKAVRPDGTNETLLLFEVTDEAADQDS